MPFLIDPQLIELERALSRNVYKDHEITVDQDDIEDTDGDLIENNKDAIQNQILRVRQLIDRRIQNGEIEQTRPWEINGPRYHIVLNDYESILRTFLAICPRCNEHLDSLAYTTRQTEYGTAYINLADGTTDHEVTDTGNRDGYDYECSSCGREVSPEEIPYYCPEQQFEQIKEMLRNHIQNATNPDPLGFNTQQMPKKKAKQDPAFFPPGRQVQKDIGAHGPNGPQMRTDEQKRIRKSFAEDFAFRNNNNWKCKHCEHFNEGARRQCANKHCKKDKFEPIKNITLT